MAGKITKEMEEKYLKENGMNCPYCEHDHISSNGVFWDTGITAYTEVRCHKCNKRWKDLYSIVGIREVK